jgi:hypothetical protein
VDTVVNEPQPVSQYQREGVQACQDNPVHSLKQQYFISYAAMGSLGPFLALFLKQQQGLQEAQIGYVMGASSLVIFFTPVLMTRQYL